MNKMPVVWEWDVGGSFCVLTAIKNVVAGYELTRGISQAKDFPANACFHMDPKFKKFVALADNLDSLDRSIIVSKRLKEFIENRGPREVEYLPVAIVNHKGKIASADYFVINPLRVVDCIDKNKSDLLWNVLDKEKIAACRRLVLKPKAIEEEFLLFRPKHFTHAVMVDPEFAGAIRKEGFTGIRFTELDEFER